LTAVLLIDAGKTRYDVADILHVSLRQLAEWLRLFRNIGVDELCTLQYKGDPGNLTSPEVEPEPS
jgi:transposase